MSRGQATVYAILGLLLIVLVGLTFAFKERLFTSSWEKEKEKSLVVPEQIKKIRVFTESCIEQTMTEGVSILAAQGGFITPPEDPLPPSPFNPFSNALDIFSTGTSSVPYWAYETANGVQKSQVPTKQGMEQHLGEYISAHLNDCLQEYAFFKKQDYHILTGRSRATVNIADDVIYTAFTFPVQILYKGFSFSLNTFYVSIDHSLGKMYKDALAIMEKENQEYFLENFALDIMQTYDGIPFSGVDFECSPRSWERSKVTTTIQQALASTIPTIKIKGTQYSLSQEFNKYFVVSTKESAKDLTVQFLSSPDWPISVSILGEDGPIIRGKPYTTENAMSKFLAQFFCLNQYHFVYDLKFPVLVTIADKDDNIFQFAVLAAIDNNQPRQNTHTASAPDTASDICEHKITPLKVDVLAMTAGGSLLPVENARISLKCLGVSCNIGTAPSGALSALFPQCFNALLTAEKEGFHKAEELITSTEEGAYTLIMQPFSTLKVQVNVIDNGKPRPLQPTEQAFFTFEERNRGYATTVVAPGQETVSLIPGVYEITSSMVVSTDPPLTLPEQTIKVCSDLPREGALGILGLKEKKCVTHTIESTSLSQLPAGTSTISWSPAAQGLANAQTITLFVVRTATPQTIKEVMNIDGKTIDNEQQAREPFLQ